MNIKIVGGTVTISAPPSFMDQLQELAKKHSVMLQAVNADYVYGKHHIQSAVEHTLRAFSQKTNSLKAMELELLLYLAGERQIQKAIEKIGIRKGKQTIALIVLLEKTTSLSAHGIKTLLSSLHIARDDSVLEGDIETLKRFNISPKAQQTVSPEHYEDLILEQVALVDIIK